MTTQATKTNRANIAKFNQAVTDGSVKSVCARVYPHIGGERAEFFRTVGTAGGWLIHTESTTVNSSRDIAIQISNVWVEKADAVEYDPYNNAQYAKEMLSLSAAVRGVDDQEGDDEY
mgnify:CR=1 FL=1